jgi:hypothetical protein
MVQKFHDVSRDGIVRLRTEKPAPSKTGGLSAAWLRDDYL